MSGGLWALTAATLAAAIASLVSIFWATRVRRLAIKTLISVDWQKQELRDPQLESTGRRIVTTTDGSLNDLNSTGDLPHPIESKLVQEVAHSLNTPLSQIAIALTRIQNYLPEAHPEVISSIRSALGSVDICRATIIAYRDLSVAASSSLSWDIEDLQESLTGIGRMFASDEYGPDSGVEIDISVPSKLQGYNNYLVVAAILPLLQNAVESAPPGTAVSCVAVHVGPSYKITLANQCITVPRLDLMEISGYTTKGHKGVGLATARTLLRRLGGKMTFEYIDGVMHVHLTLGGGDDHAG